MFYLKGFELVLPGGIGEVYDGHTSNKWFQDC